MISTDRIKTAASNETLYNHSVQHVGKLMQEVQVQLIISQTSVKLSNKMTACRTS